MFRGSSILSSFKLARGYSPSGAGILSTKVSQALLNAHVELAAPRAIHKTIKFCPGHSISPATLHKGMRAWQNDRKEWVEERVISADDYIVKCKCSAKGPPMSVVYENIRIAPKSEFVKELMRESVEEIMNDNNTTQEEMTSTVPVSKSSCESIQLILAMKTIAMGQESSNQLDLVAY